MINRLWILLCLLLTGYALIAQDTSGVPGNRLVSSYIKDIDSKAGRLNERLDKYMARALRKMQARETAMREKLSRRDSLKSMAVFGNAQEQYQQLDQRLQQTNAIQQYIPAYDSIFTSLKFLQQDPRLAEVKKSTGKLQETLSKVDGLGSRLAKAEEIKKFLQQRKQYLKDQLQNLGFARELKKLNKQAYYYSAQLSEYKTLLKDHRKAERKVIQLLSKTKLFQNFMRKNSLLASLFRLPADPDDPSSVGGASLAGLQTRAQVNNIIQQQIGPNGQAQFQHNMQYAESKLNELKKKVSQAGAGSSDEEIPDFKVNSQRKKSFWKKWELGVNTQSNKPNSLFPVTTDLGLVAGFKPHDGYVVGVGVGGLIGWGKDIRHIAISSQGMSIKSFAEIKIKGSFHFAAGYEKNYRAEIRNIEQLKDKSAWQSSCLVGISKQVSLKTKFFKKTKLSVLLDVLSYQQVPRTQPVVIRLGYGLN